MKEGKQIPRQKFALTFIIVGVVMAILGISLKFVLSEDIFYDLPWFIFGIGVIAIIYGTIQYIQKDKFGEFVEISPKNI